MEAANYGILSIDSPCAYPAAGILEEGRGLCPCSWAVSPAFCCWGMTPPFGFSALAKEALGNEDFIWILLIQVFIGIMIAFFMKAGVVKAFAEMIAGKVTNPPAA